MYWIKHLPNHNACGNRMARPQNRCSGNSGLEVRPDGENKKSESSDSINLIAD
jgi:hypothetical protein